MALFEKAKLLFKAKKPGDLKKYVGRTVIIPATQTDKAQEVMIETIKGNLTKPAFFEINGKYLIGMLRFYAQINKDDSISEAEFKEFEQIQLECVAEKSDKDIFSASRKLSEKIMKDVKSEQK